ncbi:GGDEF domain-containing protein [Kineococcus sp. SYSU DK004]|uniref:GGDEF domain-containing protein n=1 Tax=Kineococcus sp. SYSU DK004 TaxID=3383125 RepID=UPI003D7EE72C
MRRRTALSADLVPLSQRARWTAAARLLVTMLPVLLWATVAPGAAAVSVVLPALAHGTAVLSTLATSGARRGVVLAALTISLLVDSAYLGWSFRVLGGVDGVGWWIVLLHVLAITLLLSFRTGAKVTLFQSCVLLCVVEADRAGVFGVVATTDTPFPVTAFATGLGALWGACLVTAAFAAGNERELRRRRYDAEVLRRFAGEVEETVGVREVAEALTALCRRELGAVRAAVVLTGHGTGDLLRNAGVTVLEGPAGVTVSSAPVELTPGGVLAEAVRRRVPLLRTRLDPARDAWLAGVLPGARNVVVVSFPERGGSVGGLVLEHGGRGGRVDRRLVGAVEQAVAHTALALTRAALVERLRREATTDALTGLCNRRTLDGVLDVWAGRAERDGASFAVVLLDLDHFKRLNDTHGHLVGDEVLRAAAQALRRQCGPDDLAARYGGEEFAVVLADPDARGGAALLGERLRAAVEAADSPVPVTASTGVAVHPDDADDVRGLLLAADQALYAAKAGGRNRVVLATAVAEREAATGVGGPTG